MKADQMKVEMIAEIEAMDDNSRLEDEYNQFFGFDSEDYVKVDED